MISVGTVSGREDVRRRPKGPTSVSFPVRPVRVLPLSLFPHPISGTLTSKGPVLRSGPKTPGTPLSRVGDGGLRKYYGHNEGGKTCLDTRDLVGEGGRVEGCLGEMSQEDSGSFGRELGGVGAGNKHLINKKESPQPLHYSGLFLSLSFDFRVIERVPKE